MKPSYGTRAQQICCWPECFTEVEHHDLPLCEGHLRETGLAWVRDNLDVLREVVGATPVPLVIAREHNAAVERLSLRPQVRLTESNAVVYYLQVRGSDRVKIGTTTNVRQRMVDLRANGEDLLATEPGGYELEWRRHQQFADERYGRREEFALSDRLAAHIAILSGRAVIVNS